MPNLLTPNAPPPKKAFALGTSLFPVPVNGQPLVYSAGNTSTLSPIPKTGFLGRLRYTFKGTVTVGTAIATPAGYIVPLWKLVSNYTLQNSLNYPYRSLSGWDIWFEQQVRTAFSGGDPLSSSLTFLAPNLNSATQQNVEFSFVDDIWHNDGVNFSRYLLSAMTTSNDLTINFTWAQPSVLNYSTGVVTAATGTMYVSAEYLTVPNPAEYQWPRRNLIQQIIGDPSYNTPSVGLNTVNLTPIQGPEFLGIGIQIVDSVTGPDFSNLTNVTIDVNGSIPLYNFTLADLISRYERTFRRSPANGFLYLDFSNDLGLIDAMSHTHRKVLSTSKYSQISINATLQTGFTGGAGAYINIWKRTQQAYSQNS